MDKNKIWRILRESESAKKTIKIALEDGRELTGFVCWAEGRYDSESGENEAALETPSGDRIFFLANEVKDIAIK